MQENSYCRSLNLLYKFTRKKKNLPVSLSWSYAIYNIQDIAIYSKNKNNKHYLFNLTGSINMG